MNRLRLIALAMALGAGLAYAAAYGLVCWLGSAGVA